MFKIFVIDRNNKSKLQFFLGESRKLEVALTKCENLLNSMNLSNSWHLIYVIISTLPFMISTVTSESCEALEFLSEDLLFNVRSYAIMKTKISQIFDAVLLVKY